MNRKTRPLKVSKTIAGLSVIMLLAACSSGAGDASSTDEAAAPASGEACTVKVGVAAGQTGGLAYADVPHLEGFELWAEQVNANGKFSFEGHVRGTYDSLSLPDFSLKLNLGNGRAPHAGVANAKANDGGLIEGRVEHPRRPKGVPQPSGAPKHAPKLNVLTEMDCFRIRLHCDFHR
jgi:hypothetical protein